MESPRLVPVVPPSKTGEGGLVLRAAIAVALGTLFVISSRRQAGWVGEAPLLPFQQPFADLPGPLQRDYREMREGYAEAARARSKGGAWPGPEQLAADGVPPFASDGVDGKLRDWRVVHDGLTALYFGVTRADGAARDGVGARPNLLLLVVESAPNDFESRDPNTVVDEEHQRLADGTLVHVTTWYREAKSGTVAVGGDAKFQPELNGWTQMVVRDASAGSERGR